ncbi:HAD family hydrolase [Acidocella sp.]|uniref:HAD family hydrolase n=1 Tax=Acidocella sp. TaxID=50710 RepID=UPI0026388A1D|nr:HAD family hydrolase [Acidocella sp.]
MDRVTSSLKQTELAIGSITCANCAAFGSRRHRSAAANGGPQGGVAVAASPDRKREIIDTFCQERRHVAMLGDGINDAAVLAAADVGMAMGQGRMGELR